MFSRLYSCWVLLIFADFTYCKKKKCYDVNPLVLNTTVQSPDVLKCPKTCHCKYCRHNLTPSASIITYLHYVDCSSRGFTRVPVNDLPTDAVVLQFSRNSISKLNADTFKSTPIANYIDLSSNKLDHNNIDGNAFRGLAQLQKLKLSNNGGISIVHKKWLEPLISLQRISFENSHVRVVEKDAFSHLQNLTIVVLNNNGIRKLPQDLFHQLPNLARVILQYNSIASLPSNMFSGSPNILEINVAYNQLTGITKEVHLQDLNSLQKVSLQNNPYACNCGIVWLKEWLNATSVQVLSYDEIRCASGPSEVITKCVSAIDEDALHCQSRIMLIIAVSSSVFAVAFSIALLIFYHRWNIRYFYQRRKLRKQYERITQSLAPPLDQNIQYDAFISYNSKDQDWIVKVLQPTLEAPPYNLKLCVDYRDFLVGEAIAQNIANSVKFSRKTVLVITKSFVHSEWCHFEMEMAHNRTFDTHEDVFVTILLEDVKVSSMPLLLKKVLKKRTYIEWPKEEGREAFWMRLARAIDSPNVPLEASRTVTNY
ncbi:uncharacterized protein [Antedon mediterranea]|uniref:uncharacterized protein n=1 Tax=Antedon mediterranea TaxID=105859 RepID=UPI003AF6CFB4